MEEWLAEAIVDSAKMIPFLLVIYFVVELIEKKYGESIAHKLEDASTPGPAIGAFFGCIPQCGFSVIAAAMYSKRFITTGTLLAVFLSTSDEAIPIILSQPDKAKLVFPLLLTKFLIALIGGYAIDYLFRRKSAKAIPISHELEHNERGCCNHNVTGGSKKWGLLIHPIIHTAKVFVFILIITIGISYLVSIVGEENLGNYLLGNSIFQPVLCALVGLIPNCAASVAITEIFLQGGISYGSAIAGLSAGGGLGILVLLRENRSIKDSLAILTYLFGISIIFGTIIQSIYG